MERFVYQQMAELADGHWGDCARPEACAAVIGRVVRPPKSAAILEIGCGTGHNFGMLAEFGRVDALELDDQARGLGGGRVGRSIMSAPLPGLAGVPKRHYDLIAAFDVIEHIDDDAA